MQLHPGIQRKEIHLTSPDVIEFPYFLALTFSYIRGWRKRKYFTFPGCNWISVFPWIKIRKFSIWNGNTKRFWSEKETPISDWKQSRGWSGMLFRAKCCALIGLSFCYSTLGGKTGKLDEAANRELNVTRSWNLIQTVDLAWFIAWMSFKLICIFYDFKAPLLENH